LEGENPERKSSKKLSLKDYKAKKEAEERARLSTESEGSEPASQVLLQRSGSGIRCLFDPWIRDPVAF
jgi:hypothetical protein